MVIWLSFQLRLGRPACGGANSASFDNRLQILNSQFSIGLLPVKGLFVQFLESGGPRCSGVTRFRNDRAGGERRGQAEDLVQEAFPRDVVLDIL
ncbi:MAG: hypothetical protein DME25_08700 [Verrucomicrobia bacterium]|nr:MAG: hypothetical protein DME25_08700 [Verrucomicrobiota bacterium]